MRSYIAFTLSTVQSVPPFYHSIHVGPSNNLTFLKTSSPRNIFWSCLASIFENEVSFGKLWKHNALNCRMLNVILLVGERQRVVY